MKIALDMMGGDYAPLEAIRGIEEYLAGNSTPAHLVMVGNEADIQPLVSASSISKENYSIVHAEEIIGMNEHPTKALKEKPKSSISVGFRQLAGDKCDAFISAGNTGAMLVGALYSIKAIEGVLRPTISTIIPKDNGKTGLLLDVGLNADCKPEHLNQFATLGSVYARYISGIDNPRVALINIGEEEGKGNVLAQAAYALLKENQHIEFIGNIEGRDIFKDKADVMVCEGFTGNIILKLAESIYDITQEKHIRHDYLDLFNFENYGGTPVLGVNRPVIIGHGISHGKAFANMIRLAEKMIATDLLTKMAEELK